MLSVSTTCFRCCYWCQWMWCRYKSYWKHAVPGRIWLICL